MIVRIAVEEAIADRVNTGLDECDTEARGKMVKHYG